MSKINYSKLFTKRKDGVYQKYVNGKYLYSKDPEELYNKWQRLITGEDPKTFREVAEEWEAIHREEISERTWNNYKPHFKNITESNDRIITDITAQDVNQDLLRAKTQGYSLTIVKTRKAIWNQILDYAVVKDYIKYNPAASVKLPKNLPKSKRSAPTDEEIKAVIENINEPFGFFPFLLLCTGLRKGEALALTRNDIDMEKREISVTKSLVYIDNAKPTVTHPKTETSIRKVPIINILYEKLDCFLKTLPGEILFPANISNRNPGGGYMTEKGYEVAWNNYCLHAQINITAHQLRHGAATVMFESGVDVYTAQRILGHANITTTMGIYTELREKQMNKSIEKFNSGLEKYG